MTLSVRKKPKSKPRKQNNRIQRVWDLVEKQQRSNEVLSQKLDELVNRLREELVPVQIEVAQAAHGLVLHLLPFLHRKSLSQWERAEIRGWIEELLELIVPMGLLDDTLRQALARDTALQMGYVIDEHSHLSPHEQVEIAFQETQAELEASAESALEIMIEKEVEKMVRQKFGKPRSRPPVDDLFQSELNDAQNQREEDIKQFRREAEQEVRGRFELEFGDVFTKLEYDEIEELDVEDCPEYFDATKTKRPTQDPGILNRLFRRTANVLHPDKEMDETRRAERHLLMGSLLEARRKGDILTIFRLHQQHVDADATMTADDESQLLDALEQQVANLDEEMEEIIHRTPVHTHAYRTYYAKTRKVMDRRIAEHIDDSYQHAAELQKVTRQVKTLTALKPILALRSRQYAIRLFIEESL